MRSIRPNRRQTPQSTVVGQQDFATTLLDGRRVTGRRNPGGWHVHVYSPGARLVGYAVAAPSPAALQAAGLSGGSAGEVLGRIGI